MCKDLTNLILNQLKDFNFNMYQLDKDNFKLILLESSTNHEQLFTEIQNISNFLLELNVDFLIDKDGSIIIK